jgi:hypothetical protein
MSVTRFILLASTAAMAVVTACADREPARNPSSTTETTSTKQMPGESVPASPANAWTTTGGPASPGSPAMGSVTTADAGQR